MAISDEIRNEQKKLKGKSPKEILDYIWYYYKIPIILVLIVILVIFFLTKDIIRNSRPVYLQAMLLNTKVASMTENTVQEDYVIHDSIDTSKYNLYIDTSLYLGDEYQNQTAMVTMQKLLAMFSAGDIDVVVAPVSAIKMYEDAQAYSYITDSLAPDILDMIDNKELEFYYSDYDDYDDAPIGIILPNNSYVSSIYDVNQDDPIIFTLATNSKNPENAGSFLKMLLEE